MTSSSKSPQKATVSHYSTSSFKLFDVASPTQTKLFLSQSVLAHEQDVTRTIRSTSSTYLKHICPNSLYFVLYHFSNQCSCIRGTETFYFTSPWCSDLSSKFWEVLITVQKFQSLGRVETAVKFIALAEFFPKF